MKSEMCGNEARDFKTHVVYRCQLPNGLKHEGIAHRQGDVWWPNGRPNINPKAVRLAVAA